MCRDAPIVWVACLDIQTFSCRTEHTSHLRTTGLNGDRALVAPRRPVPDFSFTATFRDFDDRAMSQTPSLRLRRSCL